MQNNTNNSNSIILAPSILSADFARLGEHTQEALTAGADWVHFDVMDNHYVPNLTIGPMVCRALRDYGITAPIDVHLMVEPVDELSGSFIDAGASLITFHPEASRHVHRTIEKITKSGCQVGIALNPATPLSYLEPIMEFIDLVLIMSVNPGFGGQAFIPRSLERISQVRAMINVMKPGVRLQVDGGVNAANIQSIVEAGADTIVAGSAVFGADDLTKAITTLKKNAQQGAGE